MTITPIPLATEVPTTNSDPVLYRSRILGDAGQGVVQSCCYVLAVWPDGTEIVTRSGWKERGHSRVYKMPVNFAEEFEALCRAAEGAIESGIDDIHEVVAQGLAIIATAKKSLM
jgi:hypothetical protein